MPPIPTDSPPIRFKLALVLTLLPGFCSLVGAIPDLKAVTVIALIASPLLSVATGIVLGRQTAQSLGGKFLHCLFWSLGSFAISLLLQRAGCTLTNSGLGI